MMRSIINLLLVVAKVVQNRHRVFGTIVKGHLHLHTHGLKESELNSLELTVP